MRMTAAQLQQHLKGPAKKGRVRGTVPKTVDGLKFHSTGEADRFSELRQWEQLGIIHDLEWQVPFGLLGHLGPILTPNGHQMTYRADFVYLRGNTQVVEDFKGWTTDVFKIKRAVLAAQGVDILVSGGRK